LRQRSQTPAGARRDAASGLRTADRPGRLEGIIEPAQRGSEADGTSAPDRSRAVPAATASPPGLPRLLGDYELLEEIARGGMGVIYRARQISLNRVVALKMIRDGVLASPKTVQRFRLEAEVVARLHHPNIVSVHDFGEVDGHWFLSMSLIEGRDLARELGGAPMDARPLARLMVRLARAVHYAHQRGVLHRDLKPANVLLDAAQAPHVTDFGLAKFTDPDGAVPHSVDIVGSPNYMAPEQAVGGSEQVTTAADVYSLGAIMYETLCGRQPFRAATPLETLRKVMEEDPVPPRELYRFADADLETICLKCLEKHPRQRYDTAAALADDLDCWLEERPIRARPAGTAERVLKWARRNPLIAALVLTLQVVVVGALGAGLWMSLRIAEANEDLLAKDAENRQRAIQLTKTVEESRRRLVRLNVQTGNRLVADGNALGALPWFTEALRLDLADPVRARMHRHRIGAVARQSPQLLQIWFHPGLVQGAVFSPDGRQVATATYNDETRIWDVTTGEPATPPLPSGASYACFSPTGDLLATLTMSNEARVWDTRTGAPRTPPLKGPAGNSYHLFVHACFSPDGRRLATAAGAPTAQVWDVVTGAAALSIAHGTAIHELGWSPDGRRLVSAGEDHTARIWDAQTGQPIGDPLPHAGPVWGAGFSPDGRLIVTHTWRPAELRVWRADTGEPVTGPLRQGAALHSSAFSPDGGRVLGSGLGASASVWEATTGRQLFPEVPQPIGCREAGFSPDGRFIVTAGFDKAARVWEAAGGRPVTPVLRHQGVVNAASWSPDGERLVTASDDGTARLWDVSPAARSGHRLLGGIVTPHVVFSPDERLIAAASRDGMARVFRTSDSAPAFPPLKHGAAVTGIAFSGDGRWLLTASEDGTARLWDPDTGREIVPAMRHPRAVTAAAFSPDGRRVATAGADGNGRVWEAATGRETLPPLAHDSSKAEHGALTGLEFSPDGRLLVTASHDRTARVWDLADGKLLQTLVHEGPVVQVAFSPDGRRLVTSVWDGAPNALYAQVWEVATGEPTAPPLRFSDGVFHSAFSPDNRRVVTAAEDSQARIWDAATGRALTPPLHHEHGVRFAAFSRDGGRVATASQDGTVRLWDVESGELLAPPLRHGGTVFEARFNSRGDQVLTAGADGVRLWDVPEDERPVEDLLLAAQVAAGERLDPVAGMIPIESAELRRLWEALRSRRAPGAAR
jgi:WD40 repeat protein/tRNA A-37 threonylcarbamoyl transferase component Bud32